MDLKELRQLTEPELAEKAQQLTQELFNLRFQLGTGRLENPMQVRKTKRSIARIKTLQHELVQADPTLDRGERGLRMGDQQINGVSGLGVWSAIR